MAYKNISGTMMPTFKLRGGRLELISAVVTTDKGKLDEFRIRDSSGVHRVLDDRDITSDKLFDILKDTVISSSDVKGIAYTDDSLGNSTVKIILRNGEEIILPTKVSTEDILPTSAQDGEIALYGFNAEGKIILKNSNLTVTESGSVISERDDAIPTSKAVREYVGEVSTPLSERLIGNETTYIKTGIIPE